MIRTAHSRAGGIYHEQKPTDRERVVHGWEASAPVLPGTGRLCLDRNLIVISVLTGGAENAACFYYPPRIPTASSRLDFVLEQFRYFVGRNTLTAIG